MWRWFRARLDPPGTRRRTGPSASRGRASVVVVTGEDPRIDAGQCTPWPDHGLLVGGAVRDLLLGRQPVDLDWLVPDPAKAARLQAEAIGGSVFALDEERDHWRVVGPLPEGGSARATHDFVRAPADPHDDLWRRDLTINAVAARADGSLLDPTGGLTDLRDGVVRLTSRAALEADSVRALRAVRFAGTLGFVLDGDTRIAVKAVAASLLAGSTPRPASERVRDELIAIMRSDHAAAALALAAELGLLATVLPELDAERGVVQGGLHHLDVFGHSLQALTRLVAGFPGSSLALRLATLFHDVGKPVTAVVGEGRAVTFHGHAKVGSVLTRRALRRLRFGTACVAEVGELVRLHMLPLPTDERGARRFVHRHRQVLPDLLWLMIADREAARGRLASAAGRQTYRRAMSLVIAVLDEPPRTRPLLDGHDVMRILGIEPGRRVGEALDLVNEAVAVGDVRSREDAERLVRRYARAQGWSA